MQFNGGKQAIAKQLAEAIGDMNTPYWEPFVGCGSVIEKIQAPIKVGTDIDPHIINYLRQVQTGWVPPDTITESDYRAAKELNPKTSQEFAYRAHVGYGCSFGGKFFGGYARDPKSDRNYARAASNAAIKAKDKIQGIQFLVSDFLAGPPAIPNGSIYCDPPYKGTTRVGTGGKFNSEAFWAKCLDLSSLGYRVLVTEFSAPREWKIIKEWPIKDGLSKHGNMVERLFTLGGI